MYQTYWQLQQKPFESGADGQFYYPSEGHQVALLKLRYAVENRQGATLLVGSGGTGKSMLLQLLEKHLPDNCAPFVRLVFPQMPAVDLLTYLADELGAPAPQDARHTTEECVRRLQRFLAQNAESGRHAVVAIDEAHLLDDRRAWEALRLLLNFETEGRPQLTFLLVGQPALISTIERVPQLQDRLAAHCLLQPLTQEETLSYVSHRLTAAGASRPIFDTAALEALHELGHGNPRRINRLADLALLVGFADELPAITRAQIEAVSQEMSLAAA
jgi:general secretion pathway protein A